MLHDASRMNPDFICGRFYFPRSYTISHFCVLYLGGGGAVWPVIFGTHSS